MSDEVRLVHLADLHLGFTGPQTLVFRQGEPHTGRFVREVDVERAISAMVHRIAKLKPQVEVVVIAGAVFDRPAPLPRPVSLAAWMVHFLTRSGIEVVVVDGNHDSTPMRLHYGSPLEYLRELGAHVINGQDYEIVGGGRIRWAHPRLQGKLAVHGVPYQVAQLGDFAGVAPLPGLRNVLVVHGRVGGAPGLPEANTVGRRAAVIPSEVLRRGWDYVALGDWHIHRYQPLRDVPAYYAGSLEALTFGEAASYPPRVGDSRAIGGALDVQLRLGEPAAMTTIPNARRRPVLRVEPIDAEGLRITELMDELRRRLDSSLPSEALVRVEIRRCRREAWEGLDHAELSRLRAQVRRCEIIPEWAESSAPEDDWSSATIEQQWEAFIAAQVADRAERAELLALGQERIEAARQRVQERRVAAGDVTPSE